MAAVVFCAMAAQAAEPQCAPHMQSCFWGATSILFGNAYHQISDGGSSLAVDSISGQYRDALCDADAWRDKERCNADCPLSVEITRPAELRMKICVSDNVFSPYNPDAHLDLLHPLNGQEVEIINPGRGTDIDDKVRHGCSPQDFQDGRNYTGKFAIMRRGTCYFATKFENAAGAGAVMGAMINSHAINSIEGGMVTMSGSSLNIGPLPGVFMPRHYGVNLFAALDAGQQVFGKMQLTCSPPSADGDEDSFTDGCPHTALIKTSPDGRAPCNASALDRDRLCTRCPVEFVHVDALRPVCLWGNFLLPRSKTNHLQFTYRFPYTPSDVAMLSSTQDPCHASSFTGLRGKIVFVPRVSNCLPYESILEAQKHDVAAYVMMMPETSSDMEYVEGISSFVTIAVHVVAPYDTKLVRAAFGNDTHTPDGQHLLENVNTGDGLQFSFREGVYPEAPPAVGTDPPEEVALEAIVVQSTAFEWSATFAIAFVIAVLLVVSIAGFVVRSRTRGGLSLDDLMSEASIEITNADGDVEVLEDDLTKARRSASSGTVSLGTASTSLSLMLLTVATVTAFVLAYVSGQTSTDSAIEDGRKATSQTFTTAVTNIEDLSGDVRRGLLLRVREGIDGILEDGEELAEQVAKLYLEANGSHASVAERYDTLVEMQRATSNFALFFLTTTGYYASSWMLTEPPEGEGARWSTTTTGFNLPFEAYYYNSGKMINEYWSTYTAETFKPFQQIGGEIGDRLGFVRGKPRGFKQWHLTIEDQNWFVDDSNVNRPISVFTPVITRNNKYVGVAEAHMAYSVISTFVNGLASGKYANLTVIVYEDASKTVLSCNRFITSYTTNMFQENGMVSNTAAYTFQNLPVVEVNAFSNFIDSEAASGGSGIFEQAESYITRSHTVTDVRVASAAGVVAVAELSGNVFGVEMRDGACVDEDGGCLVYDPALKRSVMKFDGDNVVYVYRNMSLEVPRIESTRMETADGSWKSSWPTFQNTLRYGDNKTCVAHEYTVTGTSTCYVRPAPWREPHSVSVVFKPEYLKDGSPELGAQWVFSDTIVGDANLRVYANGVVQVSVTTLGCTTKPLDVRDVVGKWTTLTVVVDHSIRTEDECVVYANGKLHDRVVMAAQYSPRTGTLSPDPFVIGKKFIGSVAAVMLFNVTLTPWEVDWLYVRGVFKREVPERKWYADVLDLERRTREVAGIGWKVAALVPQEDILREVHALNEYNVAKLDAQRKNLDTALRQRTWESVIILLVLVLVGVLLVIVFNDYLTRPFAEVAHVMTDAAYMCIREVDEQDSIIRELKVMYHAMGKMLKNLESFRPYLPDTLFQGTAFRNAKTRVDVAPGASSGVACLVFTDIVSSTKTWEGCPAGMKKGLKIHNEVMRATLARFSGYEVKTVGDAFMIAFETASDAVNFALAAHIGLYNAMWPEELLKFETCAVDDAQQFRGIKVRIGVHFGEAEVEFNTILNRYDYFGNTTNRAARTEAAAVPGCVAVTPDVMEELLQECDVPDGDGDAGFASALEYPVEVLVRENVQMSGVAEPITLHMLLPEQLSLRRTFAAGWIAKKRAEVQAPQTLSPNIPSASQYIRGPSGRQGSDTGSRQSGGTTEAGVRGRLAHHAQAVFVQMAFTYKGDFMLNPLAVSALDSVMSKVLNSLKRVEGALLFVSSASVLVSFNLAKSTQRPVDKALRYIKMVNQSCFGASKVYALRGMHCGICCGPALYGNVGSRGQKFITAVAPAVTVVDHLTLTAGALGTFCLLATPVGATEKPLSSLTAARTRPIDEWESVAEANHRWRVAELQYMPPQQQDVAGVGQLLTKISSMSHSARLTSKGSRTSRVSDPPNTSFGRSRLPHLVSASAGSSRAHESQGALTGRSATSPLEGSFNLNIPGAPTRDISQVMSSATRSPEPRQLSVSPAGFSLSFDGAPNGVRSPPVPADPSPAYPPLPQAPKAPNTGESATALAGILAGQQPAADDEAAPSPPSAPSPPPPVAQPPADLPPPPAAGGADAATAADRIVWGWTDAYTEAFAKGDYTTILQSTDDPVLRKVANNLKDGRSFVLPIMFVTQ
eukprot:TRINITY_DN20933_c0_g1_i1.p1 TRINITY_DN20933_c0_g1~~TRINITY_DN20933_c0_g1_i1.p1  ORF type:complete len:2074 (+),score=572.44 TRINITY_DN20933_c0_g1_i1:51-6224(+)